MQGDHEVRTGRHRNRNPPRSGEVAGFRERGVAERRVGERALGRLERDMVGPARGGGLDPVGHDRHGSLARVPTTWTPAAEYQDIRYETGVDEAAGIAKITINRPEVRNAFRPETGVELSDAFTRAGEDLDVGVIILTGEDPDAVCSGGAQRVRGGRGGYVTGADPAKAGRHEAVGRFEVTDLHVRIWRLPKPMVAMVAGYAIGGGHVLHVVCDLTIAADNARFGQTGPKVGSFDGGFGATVLSRLVGPKKAKEIWFMCRQYDAQEALAMGLINTVVPLADLEDVTVA